MLHSVGKRLGYTENMHGFSQMRQRTPTHLLSSEKIWKYARALNWINAEISQKDFNSPIDFCLRRRSNSKPKPKCCFWFLALVFVIVACCQRHAALAGWGDGVRKFSRWNSWNTRTIYARIALMFLLRTGGGNGWCWCWRGGVCLLLLVIPWHCCCYNCCCCYKCCCCFLF